MGYLVDTDDVIDYIYENEISGIDVSELRAVLRDVPRAKATEYEELEKQGRLKILPCTIGDIAYRMVNGKIHEMEAIQYNIQELQYKHLANIIFLDKEDNEIYGYDFEEIGKSIFLSKEETQ
jgi:hypothetical protein